MSEQEFDLYLRLMARLLKLSQEQERAIADELRDHMEERFAELVRAGLTREQAIERALMEFGDAASLAGEFSALASRRRRRFWGLLSLAGTGTAALVTAGLVSLWPAAKPMNGPNQALIAQEKRPDDVTVAPAVVDDLKIRSTARTNLRQALLKEVEIAMPDSTLAEVVNHLKSAANIPILWDVALIEAGINPEEAQVGIEMKGPLYEVLDRLFDGGIEGQGLDWSDENDILRITTQDAMNERRSVRSYDLTPLVSQGISVRTIAGMLPVETRGPWDYDEPGTSTVNTIGSQLVVRANPRQHREVASLLAGLQMAAKGEADVFFADEPESTLEVMKALRRPLAMEFPDNTLREAGAYVAKELGVAVDFDSAVTEAGVNPDEAKISLTIGAIPAERALSLLLENVEGQALEAVPHHGRILITTVDAANERRTPVVYDVAPFEQAAVVRELIAAITTTTEPWDDIEPGTGTLDQPHPGVLVIRQTARVHTAIRKLIAEQRKALVPLSPEEREKRDQQVETRIYRLAGEKEEDLVRTIRATIDPDRWGDENDPKSPFWIRRILVNAKGVPVRGGFLGGEGSGPSGTAAVGADPSNQGGIPNGPAPPFSSVQSNTTVLLIRQTRAAHRRIDSLFHTIRSTTAARQARPDGALAPPVFPYGTEIELP